MRKNINIKVLIFSPNFRMGPNSLKNRPQASQLSITFSDVQRRFLHFYTYQVFSQPLLLIKFNFDVECN